MRGTGRGRVCAFLVGWFVLGSAAAQQPPPATAAKPDATLRSRPETVVWGYFSATAAH